MPSSTITPLSGLTRLFLLPQNSFLGPPPPPPPPPPTEESGSGRRGRARHKSFSSFQVTAPRRRRRRRRKEVGSFRGGRGGREEKHLFPPSFRLTKLNFFFLSYRPSFPSRESGRILHFESRWREEERLKVGESHLLLFPSLHTAPFPEKGSFENGLYCRKERRTRGKRFLPSPSSFLPFNKKVKLRESSVTHSCFFSAVSSTLFHSFPPWLLPFFPLLPPTPFPRFPIFQSSSLPSPSSFLQYICCLFLPPRF